MLGKLKPKLPGDAMRLRWFFLAITCSFIAAPIFAQKLPPDLQKQVDSGYLSREEAKILNSDRVQIVESPTNSHSQGKSNSKTASKDCANSTYTTEDSIEKGNVDLGPYLARVGRQIRRNWSAPITDKTRPTFLKFSILRDGNISKIQVVCSSGSLSWDHVVADSIRRSAPFPPLPAAYIGNHIEFNLSWPCLNLKSDLE